MTDEREQAWFGIHELLPPGWTVTPASYHSEERAWYVTAVDLRQRRRGAKHEAIEGLGDDELEAVRDLARKVGARPPEP